LGKKPIFTVRDRPVVLENVERYQKRNRIFDVNKRPVFDRWKIITRTSSAERLHSSKKTLSVPQLWRIPEKFLFNADICIECSFESGAWKFQDNELFIQSSEFQSSEQNSLHAFIGALGTGCTNFVAGKPETAGLYWRRASERLRSSCKAQIMTSYRPRFKN
jgi:hypothetical protein